MKKTAHKLSRIGLTGNADKSSCAAVVKQAARLVAATSRKVYADSTMAAWAPSARVCRDTGTLAREVELMLVFGGDGTMLRVAREIAGSRTPILGVNIGSLGFLTAVPSADLASALKQVWQGEYTFESRALIEAQGRCNGRLVEQPALNDIVVSRGIASKLIELEVRVDGNLLTRYRCDGLIFSSPTGSTAYSLAAGGAVVFPTAQVLELTPICPHTLSNRSLIVPATAEIEVKVVSPKPGIILSADGEVVSEMSTGDVLTIRRSHRAVRLMHLVGSSFCETLRRKLHWRGGAV